MKDVKGKVAFITGGASGIGLGAAKAFVNAGMKVVMGDVRQDHCDEAMAWFQERQEGMNVHAIKLDVTDRDAMARAAADTEKKFGKVHVLFNNAGMGVGGPIKQTTYDDWDWGLDVMIGGTVNGVQSFLPYILKHGEGGHILNTSSMSCIIPLPAGSAIYTTAKAAVCAMAEALRGELAADNIGVSAFCPGPVQSNIHESMKTRGEKYKKSAAQIERERSMQARPVNPLWMTNEECGERILSGIRNNDLFIFTHPEFKPGTARRFEAMLDSYPDEPINEERKKAISFLLGNKIYDEAIAIRKGPRV